MKVISAEIWIAAQSSDVGFVLTDLTLRMLEFFYCQGRERRRTKPRNGI